MMTTTRRVKTFQVRVTVDPAVPSAVTEDDVLAAVQALRGVVTAVKLRFRPDLGGGMWVPVDQEGA